MMRLETKRLIIRPFTLNDVDGSFEMESDSRVNQYTHDGGEKSRNTVFNLIKHVIDYDYDKYGYGRMAIELKENSRFIGFCGVKYLEDLKIVDLGYRLHPDYWGKGLATEASVAVLDDSFDRLKFEDIFAFVLDENQGSIRVLEKLSFKKNGIERIDGLDALRFKLTKSDWLERQSINTTMS